MNIGNARRTMQIFRTARRDQIVAWISKEGCAVHPGGTESTCQPISGAMAWRFIRKHRLPERDVHANGAAFYA